MDDNSNEPSPTSPSQSKKTYIFVICLFFFLLGFAIILFLRRYGFLGATNTANTTNNPPRHVSRGMDARDIASLPSLSYSEIKTHLARKPDHTQLECAVCLNEFKDQESLRILPDCLHVYHPGCIRPWLTKHDTCPVCRASLEHRRGSSVDLSSIIERFDHRGNDLNDDHLTVEIEGSSRLEDLLEGNLHGLHGRLLRRSLSMSELDVRIGGKNSQVTKLTMLSKEIKLMGGFKSITP